MGIGTYSHRQYIGMAAAYAVWLSLVSPPQREGERITPLVEAIGIRPICSSLLSSAENIVQNRPEKEQPCPHALKMPSSRRSNLSGFILRGKPPCLGKRLFIAFERLCHRKRLTLFPLKFQRG